MQGGLQKQKLLVIMLCKGAADFLATGVQTKNHLIANFPQMSDCNFQSRFCKFILTSINKINLREGFYR